MPSTTTISDGLDFLTKNEVCGMFACAIYDQRTDSFVVARDHIGMIPLYYGRGKPYIYAPKTNLKQFNHRISTLESIAICIIFFRQRRQLLGSFRNEGFSGRLRDIRCIPTRPYLRQQASNDLKTRQVNDFLLNVVKNPFWISGQVHPLHGRTQVDQAEDRYWHFLARKDSCHKGKRFGTRPVVKLLGHQWHGLSVVP